MRRIENNKGITLIALVITIIVLLLLAGISISMLSGQDGILNKASNAKEKTKENEDYEEVVLAAQSALADGLGKIDLTEEGALEKALGSNYIYLGEGLVEKDGKYYRVGEDGSVTKGKLRIGEVVTYTPPSVTDAKWSAEYSGLKDEKQTATDIVLNNTLDVSNANSFKVTSWKVLNISEDGTLELISDKETIGKVFLYGANGYNNAVKLLNDTCNELYGDASKGIVGRSIKVEDIEEKMTEEGLKSIQEYKNSVKFNTQETNPYTTSNYYPTIYANEKLSVINGVKKDTGLGMSEQDKYYTGSMQPSTASGVTKSIQPYQTRWAVDIENIKKYLGVTGNLSTSTNYELIMSRQDETEYWVASRCVATIGNYCGFYIRRVHSGLFGGVYDLYYSGNGGNKGIYTSIRPIISLDSDMIIQAGDGKWSVK